MRGFFYIALRWVRRCAVALLGGSVVLIGICMIVLPGPAIVVIPAGLAILSLEFAWARHWLRKVKETGAVAVRRGKRWVAGDGRRATDRENEDGRSGT